MVERDGMELEMRWSKCGDVGHLLPHITNPVLLEMRWSGEVAYKMVFSYAMHIITLPY